MNVSEALEKLLRAYEAYYNVTREDVTAPFAAEASFHSHGEQFFLVKSAKLSEAESHEYVFFAAEDCLTEEKLRTMAETAWTTGLSRVRPHSSHQSSDIVLAVLAGTVTPEAMALIPKLRYYKSYQWGFQGWSHFRLGALEVSSGQMAFNRQGRSLRKVFQSII